jgi:hypothetical protein
MTIYENMSDETLLVILKTRMLGTHVQKVDDSNRDTVVRMLRFTETPNIDREKDGAVFEELNTVLQETFSTLSQPQFTKPVLLDRKRKHQSRPLKTSRSFSPER